MHHLIQSLKKDFTILEGWTCGLYCEITLKWDYRKRILDFSMLGYIKKVLQRYKHEVPKRPQRMPYPVAQIKYGKGAQYLIPEDMTRDASREKILKVQQVVGSILYYARVVDLTASMSLSTIESEQAKVTGHNIETIEQLLDYMASNPVATVQFCASDMILNIRSDASYLAVRNGRSIMCGHFFRGWMPQDGEAIRLYGTIFTMCTILKLLATRSRTGSLIHVCTRQTNHQIDIRRTGPPTTGNANSL